MTDSNQWTEADSDIYRRLAAIAVPDRARQIATLLALLPFERDASFRAVELASGEGILAEALLRAFHNARLLALDGSESMRQATAARLAAFGDRASVAAFDMAADHWHGLLNGADCVLSSLCVHHLDAAGKRALFRAIGDRLSPDGAFLLADLIEPQRPEAREVFAATWDESARAQAAAQNDDRIHDLFAAEHWNYYRYPDPVDRPSGLFKQLTWLKEAGFAVVDCFWMQAGHAIYGGYRSAAGHGGIVYEDARAAARAATGARE